MALSFTFIDFLVGAVVLISAFYAAWRGFLSETLSIFAWAAAAFACLYFGAWLVPLAHGVIASPLGAALLAYAGVFLAVFIPLSFLSHRMSQSVKNSPIGPLDRALGLAFGVVRGLVIVGLAYLAFTYFVPVKDQPRWMTGARSLPLIQQTGDVLLTLVPGQAHRDLAGAGTPPRREKDALGALIRRQDAAAVPVQHRHALHGTGQKGYGAADRRALDRLLETTRGGGDGRQ